MAGTNSVTITSDAWTDLEVTGERLTLQVTTGAGVRLHLGDAAPDDDSSGFSVLGTIQIDVSAADSAYVRAVAGSALVIYSAAEVSGGGGGSGPAEVEVTNFPATQPVSGPLTNAQLVAVTGTAAQTAVTTDPAAAGQTTNAILRGILTEMQAQTAILTQIETNTQA